VFGVRVAAGHKWSSYDAEIIIDCRKQRIVKCWKQKCVKCKGECVPVVPEAEWIHAVLSALPSPLFLLLVLLLPLPPPDVCPLPTAEAFNRALESRDQRAVRGNRVPQRRLHAAHNTVRLFPNREGFIADASFDV
jgi:hypothetical protein